MSAPVVTTDFSAGVVTVSGRRRVRRLMKLAGLRVRKTRKYRVTTRSDHHYPVSPNLDRVADITYIKTLEGWLYLAVVMDLFLLFCLYSF